jgi:DNA-binding NarL/FixJ family response regulator
MTAWRPNPPPDTSGQPAQPRLRILVAEDHPMLRHGITTFLEQQPDLECCGETDAVAGMDLLVADLEPDLLLLDSHLADGESFPMIEVLKRRFPSLLILVFSQSNNPVYVNRALRAGARGYLLKHDAVETILVAVRTVLTGRVFLSPSLHLGSPDAAPGQEDHPSPGTQSGKGVDD